MLLLVNIVKVWVCLICRIEGDVIECEDGYFVGRLIKEDLYFIELFLEL